MSLQSLGRERETGLLLACTMQTPPFVPENMGLEDTTARAVTDPVSRESVVFLRKASVIMYWLWDSCEEGGKCPDFTIWNASIHLFLANIMNNMSRSIIFDCVLHPYCRCCAALSTKVCIVCESVHVRSGLCMRKFHSQTE